MESIPITLNQIIKNLKKIRHDRQTKFGDSIEYICLVYENYIFQILNTFIDKFIEYNVINVDLEQKIEYEYSGELKTVIDRIIELRKKEKSSAGINKENNN